MINYETIISNFDDKVTLYNWLRKVEEALKNASATNFVVNKKGNATLSFSITFADGETLESGDIVLQQGESVDQARIASGILQLHLTNGTWLTAGNIKPVSNFSIDANQHLIVNYQDGTSQDLGAIFTGNVAINGNLVVTNGNVSIDNYGNVAGNTFEQSKANYSYPIYVGSNVDVDNVYSKFLVINDVLHIVFNFKLTNNTGNATTLYSVASCVGYLNDKYAEKVIDFDGDSVHEAKEQTPICMAKGYMGTKQTMNEYELQMLIFNYTSVNSIRIDFENYNGITLQPNETKYVTGRIALTLIDE